VSRPTRTPGAAHTLSSVADAHVEARAGIGTRSFADRVADAVEAKRTQLVVGLDPRVDLLPVELRGEAVLGRAGAGAAVTRFCKGIVDAVAPYAVAVKPQAAFFEALGADGFAALEDVCLYAREAGLLVLVDAKRGDIGSTARAYAAAYLEPRPPLPPLADALTVNPYLGADSIEPFLLTCRRYGAGIFLLVRTSNSGASDIQDLALSDGRPLWHHVADLVHEWGADLVGERGTSSVGAVVGATYPRAIGEARRAMPQAILLLPGVGAQGATPADVARAFTSGPASGLVAASRSVIYAYRSADAADWREAAGRAAARLAAETWAAAGW
jgi:orotidine-5'-phosphate decarboxylase